jgi:aldose 1-epimerase
MSHGNSSIRQDRFGTTADGLPVDRFTLDNGRGAVVRLIAYGAAVTELWVPDRRGQAADVVLGYDTLRAYEADRSYLGGTVGRVAFRIPRGRFDLDGRAYTLTLNVPPNHLHGGVRGFSKNVWKAEPNDAGGEPAVKFMLRSPDGDQGYPGAVEAGVTYTLTRQNALRIDYAAATDRATPVSMTHHGYFNLSGQPGGDVLGHALTVPSHNYAPLNADGVSIGKFVPVAGTPFDLREPATLRERMRAGVGGAGGVENALGRWAGSTQRPACFG